MATKSKILVVDDEDTICEVLKLNLEMAGYDVDTANSAEAAMKKPLADYDLYIIDVMMGEMNGFDFASKIRATEALKEIPIIICTAKDSEEDLLDLFPLVHCSEKGYIYVFQSLKGEYITFVSSNVNALNVEDDCYNEHLDAYFQKILPTFDVAKDLNWDAYKDLMKRE